MGAVLDALVAALKASLPAALGGGLAWSTEGTAPPARDAEKLQVVLSQLTRYLIENDTEALDFLLSHQAMFKQCLGKDYASVSALVHGFEFDEALELLLQKTRPQP